jgi:hypothetical protein
MKLRTKKVVVNGQEHQMYSSDGQTWFLRPESLREFEARMQGKVTHEEELDIEPIEPEVPELQTLRL